MKFWLSNIIGFGIGWALLCPGRSLVVADDLPVFGIRFNSTNFQTPSFTGFNFPGQTFQQGLGQPIQTGPIAVGTYDSAAVRRGTVVANVPGGAATAGRQPINNGVETSVFQPVIPGEWTATRPKRGNRRLANSNPVNRRHVVSTTRREASQISYHETSRNGVATASANRHYVTSRGVYADGKTASPTRRMIVANVQRGSARNVRSPVRGQLASQPESATGRPTIAGNSRQRTTLADFPAATRR